MVLERGAGVFSEGCCESDEGQVLGCGAFGNGEGGGPVDPGEVAVGVDGDGAVEGGEQVGVGQQHNGGFQRPVALGGP